MADTASVNSAAATALTTPGTTSDSITAPSRSDMTALAARLTENVGGSRSEARLLHQEYEDLHQQSHDVEWRSATAERAKAGVTTMLGELADLGFAWRDVARLIGVSVPAVQKWRRGEKATGTNRMRLAGVLAACDIITEHYMVEEVASWFEMPLSSSAPVTPIDLYAKDRVDLLFEFAGEHADPEVLLNQFDPDWRERHRSDFEVFEASDGRRSIRPKA